MSDETVPGDSVGVHVNVDDIRRYFSFLCPDEREIFCGWFCDQAGEKPLPGYGVSFGTCDEFVNEAVRLNAEASATLHVVLNRTTHRGRKTKDIESCRVLCVDLDDPVRTRDEVREIVTTYGCGMVVESSPGKFHLYWRVSRLVQLVEWAEFQSGLARRFGGDRNMSQLNHTIRVPGIPRVTKAGSVFVPQVLVWAPGSPALDVRDVEALFPWIHDEAIAAGKERAANERRIKTVLGDKSGRRFESHIPKLEKNLGRNVCVYEVVKERAGYVDEVELDEAGAYALAGEVNRRFSVPLEEVELQRVSERGLTAGLEAKNWKKEKIKLEQEKLEALLVNDSLVRVNGHVERRFEYDYKDPLLAQNRFTDTGIAARVLQRFADKMVACGRLFYAFDEREKTWIPQDDTVHRQLFGFYQQAALDVLRDPEFIDSLCIGESGNFSEDKKRKAEEKFLGLRLHNLTIKAVRHSPSVKTVLPDAFDAQPHMLYVGNGALDMLTGKVREPEPLDYMLKRTAVEWKADAECAWWRGYLSEIFSENSEPEKMVEFVQELFGYSLSGSIHAQKVFCHHGDGCNGKSKVLFALAEIGGSYSTEIDPDDIVSKKNSYGGKAFERIGAKIEGHRIAIIDDIGVKTVWNENFLKNLTNKRIRARAEHEKSRVVANRSKVHFGLNISPSPEEENFGLLRRVCLIPYHRTFEPDDAMSALIEEKIREESSGILRWAVEGYQKYVKRGKFLYPKEMGLAVEEYRQEHFKLEEIITGFYEPSGADEKSTEGWQFLADIVHDIENYVRQAGYAMNKEINPDSISTAIKRKFGFSSVKKWCSQRKNAFRAYPLKLKFERVEQNSTNLL